MAKQEKTQKLPKGVTEEFLDEVNSMSTDSLKATVVRLQVQNQENEEFKAGPAFQAELEAFEHAKARFDITAGPVKDTTVSIRNRTKIVVERLKEKGGA